MRRLKILLYTDSRGKRIRSKVHNLMQDHKHYSDRLLDVADVDRFLCPEQKTTTIDFIRTIESKNLNNYDWVVLHTSVVENSPRLKLDVYEQIYKDPLKKPYFDRVFGEENMKKHMLVSGFGKDYLYEGERTWNMFTKDMGVKFLIPRLERINNLIWISNNPLVGGNGESWRGCYWKDRPKNMQIVNEYSKEYIKNMKRTSVIDFTKWSDYEIKKYTVDNIHYTKEGSDLVFSKIMDIIR